LSADAAQDFWLGPADNQPPAFASDDERRASWLRHRDLMMEWYGSHGRRPQAWWRYDAGDLRFDYDTERSTLFTAGALADRERSELLTHWREQFDRAHRPDFFVCMGPGKFFFGDDARRKHFKWADIPPALVEAWEEERARSASTIRELEAAAEGDRDG
jgi:hypothetical protein